MAGRERFVIYLSVDLENWILSLSLSLYPSSCVLALYFSRVVSNRPYLQVGFTKATEKLPMWIISRVGPLDPLNSLLAQSFPVLHSWLFTCFVFPHGPLCTCCPVAIPL